MAVNPAARRQDGVKPLSPSDLGGSRGADGRGVDLPTATYSNPGPTENMRGVEANTAWTWEGNTGEPVITQTFGSEVPRGEVFNAPDASGNDVVRDAPDGWDTYDSASNNSDQPLWPQVGSFTKMGEKYPGNKVNGAENA